MTFEEFKRANPQWGVTWLVFHDGTKGIYRDHFRCGSSWRIVVDKDGSGDSTWDIEYCELAR